MSLDSKSACDYEAEALLYGGWSIRQLKRQMNTQFYERALLSKNKADLLQKETPAQSKYEVPPEEEIKDPFVLEFLSLKDEYSELAGSATTLVLGQSCLYIVHYIKTK